MGAGALLELAGEAWDGRWHATNGKGLERGAKVLEAHAGIYLGAVAMFVGACVLVAATRRLTGGTGLAVAATAAQLGGVTWDGWAHSHGYDPAAGHVLEFGGFGVALLALVYLASEARRQRRAPVGSPSG